MTNCLLPGQVFILFTVTSSSWETRKENSQDFRVTLLISVRRSCLTCQGQADLLVTSPEMILAESSELAGNCSGFGLRKFAKSGLSPQSEEIRNEIFVVIDGYDDCKTHRYAVVDPLLVKYNYLNE